MKLPALDKFIGPKREFTQIGQISRLLTFRTKINEMSDDHLKDYVRLLKSELQTRGTIKK